MVIRLKIGSITLASAAALAPMAGVADRAFRELCVRFGAAYVVGEMVSAKGITMGDRKSAELLSLSEAERPAAIQLFGDDPSIMQKPPKKRFSTAHRQLISTWAALRRSRAQRGRLFPYAPPGNGSGGRRSSRAGR